MRTRCGPNWCSTLIPSNAEAGCARLLRPEHPSTLITMNHLEKLLLDQSRPKRNGLILSYLNYLRT